MAKGSAPLHTEIEPLHEGDEYGKSVSILNITLKSFLNGPYVRENSPLTDSLKVSPLIVVYASPQPPTIAKP